MHRLNYLQLGLMVVISALFGGCQDKAAPSYEQCVQLFNEGDSRGALDACKAAIAANPTSKSGKEAVIKLAEIKASDKGTPNYEQCVQLYAKGDLRGAYNACNTAVAISPTSISGEDAVTMLSKIKAWKPSSLEDVKKYVPDVWTYSQTYGQTEWVKLVVNANGTAEHYSAFAAADNWGKPRKLSWKLFSDKDTRTGERYYGFSIGEDFVFVLTDFTTLNMPINDQRFQIYKRGDGSPFSK